MVELSNGTVSLSLESSPLRISAAFPDTAAPQVHAAQFSVRWLDQGEVNQWNGELLNSDLRGPVEIDSAHGTLNLYEIKGMTEDESLEVGWEFALPRDRPLVLWRASVSARRSRLFELLDIDLLRVGPIPPPGPVSRLRPINPFAKDTAAGRLEFPSEDLELAWLSDGWQSWSFSGVVSGKGTLTGTRLGPITRPMYLNQGARRVQGAHWHTSEFFGVLADTSARCGLLVGQLSEQQAFASLEGKVDPRGPAVRLYANGDRVRLKSEQKFTTDWAVMYPVDLDASDPLGPYIEAVARENQARVQASPDIGWSSWYYYFDNVSRQDLEANLAWLRGHVGSVPIQFVQIDDGHQRAVGDWARPGEGFGNRAHLADKIREAGFTPGIWLAPFAAHPESELVEQHPDWLLRGKGGRPVRAGYNWGTFFVGLDLTHPEVKNYIRRTIRLAVHEWGFRYLKLDFLYAGALMGRRQHLARTRAQALRRALEIIREEAGEDVHLAGCGCPLGPAVGIVDSMRVGPDVAARWAPAYQGIEFFFEHEPSLPSARNSIQNTLSRASLNGRWWTNDPDCLLVRADDSHLEQHEVETLATVAALSGGALTISDALPELDHDRVEMFTRLLPPIGRAARVVDWFDQVRPQRLVLPLEGALGRWWLLAVLNWNPTTSEVAVDPERLGLEPEPGYVAFDWWRSKLVELGGSTWTFQVPSHGVRLLRVQQKQADPAWLGDSLHISGGNQVVDWRVQQGNVKTTIDLGRRGSGSVWLSLDDVPREIRYDDEPAKIERLAQRVYRVDLEDIRTGTLRVDM